MNILKLNNKMKSSLDPEQLNAVQTPIGNVCVFAVAGSGKTRVLTYRVAALIDNNIPEEQIMLLTFTNKASQEMISRIKVLLEKDSLNLFAGTFHSIAARFLRIYYDKLGYKENFNIIDQDEQRALMQSCRVKYMKNYNADEDSFPAKNVLCDIYSGAINHNMTFEQYIETWYPYITGEDIDGILLIFEDFVAKKKDNNVMDFDDLLLNFFDLLNIDEVRDKITKQFKYFFVDEYQDINWIQYELLEKLNKNNSLFVIGDSSQCIYQFRGSNDKYIDTFVSTHKDAKKFNLTYNYRSTPQILKLAEESINNNRNIEYIKLNTKNKDGKIPYILGSDTEYYSAIRIAQHIYNYHSNNYSNVAILVRKRAQMSVLEKVLKSNGIPCNMLGYISMYQTEHIKDLVSILIFLNNPANELAFSRTIKLFPGVGDATAEKIFKELSSNNYNINSINVKSYSGKAQEALLKIKEYASFNFDNVGELLNKIYSSFYKSYMRVKMNNIMERTEDVDFLIDSAMGYKKICKFLDEAVLEINSSSKRNLNNVNCVTITTMHKSKGLEWDYVYLPFINKGEFPRASQGAINENAINIQNERKLFYVAITRAKKELVLTYSMQFQMHQSGASVFLEEFSPDSFEHIFE